MKKKEKKSVIKIPTKRLILRPQTVEELQHNLKIEQDQEMQDAYRDMIAGVEAHEKEWIWYTDWSICLKDGTKIGGIGFKGPATEESYEVEVGYGIDEPYRRCGYALEALKAMTDWALSQGNVYYVIAQTEPGNEASQNLLKKAEFTATGKMGEEGPLFEKERPASSFATTYMCLGLSVGMCFGLSIFDNLAIGMCLGMGIGTCLGYGLDAKDKEFRKTIKQKRNPGNEED